MHSLNQVDFPLALQKDVPHSLNQVDFCPAILTDVLRSVNQEDFFSFSAALKDLVHYLPNHADILSANAARSLTLSKTRRFNFLPRRKMPCPRQVKILYPSKVKILYPSKLKLVSSRVLTSKSNSTHQGRLPTLN